MKLKKCAHCKDFKTIDNFYNDRKRKDKHNPYCKDCCYILATIRLKNPENRK